MQSEHSVGIVFFINNNMYYMMLYFWAKKMDWFVQDVEFILYFTEKLHIFVSPKF